MLSDNYKLQFITHCNSKYSYIESARIALNGGCRWIQLRMKDATESLFEETAKIILKMCMDNDATLIINDNVALTKKIKANGVHLGKNDMSINKARKILGKEYIIGCTVNSFEDVLLNLRHAIPSYFGCGPFRHTSTKKNLAPILDFEGYRDILQKMRNNNIDIPLIAIGGIGMRDIPQLLECGVSGIALSSSILNADNPIQEMGNIKNMIFNIKQ